LLKVNGPVENCWRLSKITGLAENGWRVLKIARNLSRLRFIVCAPAFFRVDVLRQLFDHRSMNLKQLSAAAIALHMTCGAQGWRRRRTRRPRRKLCMRRP
jgi:hypothetical protein